MSAFWAAGECMLELRPGQGGSLNHAVAGDSFNTAVYLKRLMPALPVRYVSALGDDAISGLIRVHMREHGIDDGLVASLPGRAPGLYAIATAADGERHFTYWRAQSAARSMLDHEHMELVNASVARCSTLLLTGISLAILDDARRQDLLALAAQVRAAGGNVVLDNNYRSALWAPETARAWIDRATRVSTHALFSFDDDAVMYHDTDPARTLARLLALGVGEAVLKLGAAGCMVAQPCGAQVQVPARVVKAVDTTAAGDSFNAGYLARRLAGDSCLSAARFGCELAAAVVAHEGAIIPRQAMPRIPA